MLLFIDVSASMWRKICLQSHLHNITVLLHRHLYLERLCTIGLIRMGELMYIPVLVSICQIITLCIGIFVYNKFDIM